MLKSLNLEDFSVSDFAVIKNSLVNCATWHYGIE